MPQRTTTFPTAVTNSTIGIGIDIGDRTSHICVLDGARIPGIPCGGTQRSGPPLALTRAPGRKAENETKVVPTAYQTASASDYREAVSFNQIAV